MSRPGRPPRSRRPTPCPRCLPSGTGRRRRPRTCSPRSTPGTTQAVRAWIVAHTPEPESLLLYGLFLGAGVIGLLEWPAVALSCVGQYVVDRRFGGVENLAAQLRARMDALTA